MLGVIIQFLIQLPIVILTVGEDFPEQRLFTFPSSMHNIKCCKLDNHGFLAPEFGMKAKLPIVVVFLLILNH